MPELETATTPPAVRSVSRFAAPVQFLVAGLLTFAALMKTYHAIEQPDLASPWTRVNGAALIEFEVLLAAMLALRLRPREAWGIAVATFTIFAGVTARRALGGAKSCGCFGPVAM